MLEKHRKVIRLYKAMTLQTLPDSSLLPGWIPPMIYLCVKNPFLGRFSRAGFFFFKSLLKLLQYYFCFMFCFVFFFSQEACEIMWNLSSLTKDQTCAPCIGRRRLNHWTTVGRSPRGQFMRTVSLEAAWLGASLDHLLLDVRRKEDEVRLKYATYNQHRLELPRVRGQKDSFHPKGGGASVSEETASV